MVGYLANARLGAITYNALHSWVPGLVVLGVGLWRSDATLTIAGTILAVTSGWTGSLATGSSIRRHSPIPISDGSVAGDRPVRLMADSSRRGGEQLGSSEPRHRCAPTADSFHKRRRLDEGSAAFQRPSGLGLSLAQVSGV